MKLLASCLLLSFSLAAQATTLVPEITPQDPGYKGIQDLVTNASKNSSRYLDFTYEALKGSLCFSIDTTAGKDAINTVLLVDGKYFLIPTGFSSADNFHEFYVDNGSGGNPPGIYLIQTGFRVDLQLDRPVRVTATLRIADLAGNILPALEYNESMIQAQTPQYLETNPRVDLSVSPFLLVPDHSPVKTVVDGPFPSDMLVKEIQPGTSEYVKVSGSLNYAQGDSAFWFFGLNYAGITGRFTIEGPYIFAPNSAIMDVELNGRVFVILYNYFYFDNWLSFTRETTGAAPGIYMTHRGFRQDGAGGLNRVIAKTRIADLSGTILPQLEYHEDAKPATGTGRDILIERGF